ncbi:MAG: IS1380 family transposase [Aliifodinibius sp.]|nr:IS1380 family transposase [Fodinibius sp.]NIV15480.1 IS1380 family transposase [Fodinibius sp.]NIY29319.1 IS1380 family transposase [Fodinibius sp.]
MKVSKKSIQSKTHAIPEIQFQDQKLTSYSGITFLQLLFKRLDLKDRINNCFNHMNGSSLSYGYGIITLTLVVHLFLGKRKLQDIRFYENDPMVLRLLGLASLPDCSTISRRLSKMNAQCVENVRHINREIVLDRMAEESFPRVTLDFDGSVQSTGRFAEGTAVGFNKQKKGQRSYYPLYCTIAQTGQAFDVWHRPGNVHDSNGAKEFILACIDRIKSRLPNVMIELRMDSAFFSDSIVKALNHKGVEFSISVPFARYTELKSMIETRKRWKKLDGSVSFFESEWKPKSWETHFRFVFVRELTKLQRRGPVQLDMFTPFDSKHEFKVILTNKKLNVKKLIQYHNGRGYQESLFAEMKSQIQMDYIPTKTLAGNQIYLLASMIVHNLNREMQMLCYEPERNTTEKRTPLWFFEKIETIRSNFINIAGRLTKPNGRLTLTMNKNDAIEHEYTEIIDALAA